MGLFTSSLSEKTREADLPSLSRIYGVRAGNDAVNVGAAFLVAASEVRAADWSTDASAAHGEVDCFEMPIGTDFAQRLINLADQGQVNQVCHLLDRAACSYDFSREDIRSEFGGILDALHDVFSGYPDVAPSELDSFYQMIGQAPPSPSPSPSPSPVTPSGGLSVLAFNPTPV